MNLLTVLGKVKEGQWYRYDALDGHTETVRIIWFIEKNAETLSFRVLSVTVLREEAEGTARSMHPHLLPRLPLHLPASGVGKIRSADPHHQSS